jgi:hypothetical protein
MEGAAALFVLQTAAAGAGGVGGEVFGFWFLVFGFFRLDNFCQTLKIPNS